MKQQINISIDGKPYAVEIEDLNQSPVHVTVNGTRYTVEVETTAAAPVIRPVAAAPAPAPVPAPVAAAPVPAVPEAGGGGSDIRAPMPGIIREVLVKPGDTVTPGQQVLSLEAMKMKSAIRTNRGGVIAAVEVASGQKVAYGQVLIRFA